MRSNLAETALRLYPRRCAICAALCPAAQSFFSSAISFTSQLMANTYTPVTDYRLVGRACLPCQATSCLSCRLRARPRNMRSPQPFRGTGRAVRKESFPWLVCRPNSFDAKSCSNATGKTMDVQNGLYTARIEMRDAKRSYATGVLVLHNERILGGDTYFYYTGSYSFKNGKWRRVDHPPAHQGHRRDHVVRRTRGKLRIYGNLFRGQSRSRWHNISRQNQRPLPRKSDPSVSTLIKAGEIFRRGRAVSPSKN